MQHFEVSRICGEPASVDPAKLRMNDLVSAYNIIITFFISKEYLLKMNDISCMLLEYHYHHINKHSVNSEMLFKANCKFEMFYS